MSTFLKWGLGVLVSLVAVAVLIAIVYLVRSWWTAPPAVAVAGGRTPAVEAEEEPAPAPRRRAPAPPKCPPSTDLLPEAKRSAEDIRAEAERALERAKKARLRMDKSRLEVAEVKERELNAEIARVNERIASGNRWVKTWTARVTYDLKQTPGAITYYEGLIQQQKEAVEKDILQLSNLEAQLEKASAQVQALKPAEAAE